MNRQQNFKIGNILYFINLLHPVLAVVVSSVISQEDRREEVRGHTLH